MFKLLKQDSILLGIILGIIIPVIFWGLFYLIAQTTAIYNKGIPMIQNSTIMLISIFSNMFALRFYLIKLKADKTGRGLLLITFVLAFIFIIWVI